MARELLLGAIGEILGMVLLEQRTGIKPNLTELVYIVFDKNIEKTIGIGKEEFCERMEKLKWIRVGDRGEAMVTSEGEAVLENIEVGEDLEGILEKWEGSLRE